MKLIFFYGASLTCQDKLIIKIYFSNITSSNLSNYKIYVDDKLRTDIKSSSSGYNIALDGERYTDLNKMHCVEIKDLDDNVLQTINYSAFSYCYTSFDANQQSIDLSKSQVVLFDAY